MSALIRETVGEVRADWRRVPEQTRKWVATCIGARARVVRVAFIGVSSTAQHSVDVADGRGVVHPLVLRRFVRLERLATDPWYRPDREAAALRLLERSLMPAPRLVAADLEARICDVPCLLVTRLRGRPLERRSRSPRFLEELAETLASIHAVDGSARSRVPLDRPYYEPDRLKAPAWSRRLELWQQAIRVAASPSPALPGCFLHRDYHPGNTIWLRGRLSGVVDWTSASLGPASVDVGHMRWNLALSKGVRAADRFLELYRLASGQRMNHQPYFDVRTVVDLIPDLSSPDPQGTDILRLEAYLRAVLERV